MECLHASLDGLREGWRASSLSVTYTPSCIVLLRAAPGVSWNDDIGGWPLSVTSMIAWIPAAASDLIPVYWY